MSNADKFFAAIRKWEAEQKIAVAEVARGLSAEAFNYIVKISPQYSGDFAANWKYNMGSVDSNFKSGLFQFQSGGERLIYRSKKRGDTVITRHKSAKTSIRRQGHPEAVNYAYISNSGKDAGFNLTSKAYISNSAVHSEPYAWDIENGTIKFREGTGNHGHIRAETMAHLVAKFGVISQAAAKVLQHTSVGVAGGWV